MKKVLITGANGFVGSFMVEEAIRRGYDVYAAMRAESSKANLEGLSPKFIDLPYADKNRMKKCLAGLRSVVGQFDLIIHTMGLTKCKHKSDFDVVNFEYTRNFVQALMESGMTPKHFIYLSSLSAFGSGDRKTLKPIELTDEPKPDTAYGASKLKTERFLATLDAKVFPYTILRPTGIYGPKEKDYFVMLKTLTRHLNPGIGFEPQYITFIYVKDLVDLAFLAAEKKGVGKAYFAADGDVWTSDNYVKLCKQLLGVKRTLNIKVPCCIVKVLAFLFDKIGGLFGVTPTLNMDKYNILSASNWKCDIEPLKKDFDFKARYNLVRGLKESIRWYRQNNWL
jgi:nucleoside-diphosphate-sugar epimerase